MTDFKNMTLSAANLNRKTYAEFADWCQKNDRHIVLEDGVYISRENGETAVPYYVKRESEYPSIGDMIDAICKDKAGNPGELSALITKRNEIKAKYPKA